MIHRMQPDPSNPRSDASPRVWIFDMTQPWFERLGHAGPTTEEERAKAARMVDPRHGRWLLARRVATRMLLGVELGCAAEAVEFDAGAHGKPRVRLAGAEGTNMAFSTSHSGELFALAVAYGADVGVDVERTRDVPRASEIARRWFLAHEAAAVEEARGEDQVAEFLRLWVGKEALVKRHGGGLRLLGNTTRDRADDLGPEDTDVDAQVSVGTLCFFEPADAVYGALACSVPIAELHVTYAEEPPWTT
jgi:4'-phosphopantetheinyl transferase